MVRGLADLGLLGDVRYTSSVSGGSWANALLALRWADLKAEGFTTEAVDRLITRPFVETITTKSLMNHIVRNLWKVLGPKTRSDLLGDAFDEWFGHGQMMGDLPRDARFIFNSTNLNSGTRFFFEQARAGDWKAHYVPGDTVRVADALAASAALPGALSAQRMRSPNDVYPREHKPYLVDGAVYDNLGLEPYRSVRDRPLLVVLDAGGELKTGIMGRRRAWATVKRSSSVMQNQVTSVRKRWLVDNYRSWEEWEEREPEAYAAFCADPVGNTAAWRAWERRRRKGKLEPGEAEPAMPPRDARRGVIFSLDTTMEPNSSLESSMSRHQRWSPDPDAPEVPAWRAEMDLDTFRDHCAGVPMSAGKFDPLLARDLVFRGWWLTRETMRTFQPDALDRAAPNWSEWWV